MERGGTRGDRGNKGMFCLISLNYTAVAQFFCVDPRVSGRWLTDESERALRFLCDCES